MNNTFLPNAARPPISPVIRSSGRQSVFKIILAVFAIMVAALLGLIVLLLIGAETGPVQLVIRVVCATLPVPIYVMLLLWIDRYASEPLWMLATAFFWGALIAVFFAFLFNTASGLIVAAMTRSLTAGEMFAAVISAPIVEETAKALILFIFFFWKADEFDGVVDGIVYASLVGLGFAMTENIQYYSKEVLAKGGEGLTILFIIRGALAPFSHPLFTSMTGIGLGLARQTRNTALKLVTPILGLLTAICLHSIWNGSAAIFCGGVFVLTYLLLIVPAFLIILFVIFLALRREGQVVRQFLMSDLERGMLTNEENNQPCTLTGRLV